MKREPDSLGKLGQHEQAQQARTQDKKTQVTNEDWEDTSDWLP